MYLQFPLVFLKTHFDFIKTTQKEITFHCVHISETQQDNSMYANLVFKKL